MLQHQDPKTNSRLRKILIEFLSCWRNIARIEKAKDMISQSWDIHIRRVNLKVRTGILTAEAGLKKTTNS